ncbi:Pkinase-domain-containing protein [Lipomyces arxii]|uniref:Pkinase-domain-containing protein n=1 Tax=Lipomyces arxii TaxID=56418 RepID=UPI0034CFD7AB
MSISRKNVPAPLVVLKENGLLLSEHSGLRSPRRQHVRVAGTNEGGQIRETLNAKLNENGEQQFINQYQLLDEIGRGVFGVVRKAVDLKTGEVYAIKEFSKSKLRRLTKAALLRERGPRSPRPPSSPMVSSSNPLDLVRREIAILKRLNHVNVASLFEVLDDPDGDSLFMVLEWCGKGVLMKLTLDEIQTPYNEEQCRLYFRDLVLGIEYLHSRGVIHRDIKPDNLLLNHDDVVKIVDFGVSEMFNRAGDRAGDGMSSKRVGSPAFMSPEMNNRALISGRAADVWAMGVTLFCLVTGRLPWAYANPVELARAIREDEYELREDVSLQLRDLIGRMLDKDQQRRITLSEIRIHPWVTAEGEDVLVSEDENVMVDANYVTASEVALAITSL